jgi:hypothetical protein
MELEQAQQIFKIINNSRYTTMAYSLLQSAVRYSRLRVDWYFSEQQQRTEMDEERTISHNAFISECDILSRNMKAAGEDNQWRLQIGNDRKSIGDFACLLQAVIGLKAR